MDMMQSLAFWFVFCKKIKAPFRLRFSLTLSQPMRLSNLVWVLVPEAGRGKNWTETVNRSMCCWETDHYLKRHCQVFQDDLNSEDKVWLGSYLLGIRLVYIRRDKPRPGICSGCRKVTVPVFTSCQYSNVKNKRAWSRSRSLFFKQRSEVRFFKTHLLIGLKFWPLVPTKQNLPRSQSKSW